MAMNLTHPHVTALYKNSRFSKRISKINFCCSVWNAIVKYKFKLVMNSNTGLQIVEFWMCLNLVPSYDIHFKTTCIKCHFSIISWSFWSMTRGWVRETNYLSLDHGWSLSAQHFNCLKDVDHSFIFHPLEYDTQSDEDSCPANSGTI